MTKDELTSALADSCCSKSEAGACLDKMLETISNSLAKDEEVRIPGFGTFSVSHRKARKGRNPRTGEAMQIAATKVPKFKAGKGLKDKVKG